MADSPTLGSALRPAFGDAAAILRHRSLPAVLLAFATLCLAMYAVVATRTLDAVAWADRPGLFALGFLFYADAMRLVLATNYRATFVNVLKFAAVYALLFAAGAVCVLAALAIMAPIHLNHHTRATLQWSTIYVVSIFVETRLCFAVFALKDYGVFRACSHSWVLTGRRTFLPTVALLASVDIAWFLINAGLNHLRHTIQPFDWIIYRVVVSFVFLGLTGSFLYPGLARWMLVCERLHSSESS